MIQNDKKQWVRREPDALGPNRAFGGYYRSADRMVDGKLLRGVPLQTTQDAVVAAVQLGYRVVDSQIDRGMRAAQRMRGAAERQGSGDPAQMLDAGERLASKAMVAGLRWLENAAAEPGSPVKRLLSAEYDMLGSLFGLRTGQAGASAKRRKSGAKSAGRAEAPDSGDAASGSESTSSTSHDAARTTKAGKAADPAASVRILHEPGSAKRAIRVRRWDLPRGAMDGELPVDFFCLDAVETDRPDGHAGFVDGRPLLRITTGPSQRGGRWRAAVCSPDGEQLGLIEIEL